MKYTEDEVYEIVDDLLGNAYEHHLDDFMTLQQQANLLGEVIGTIANYKHESGLTYLENKHELLAQIRDRLHIDVKYFVELKND